MVKEIVYRTLMGGGNLDDRKRSGRTVQDNPAGGLQKDQQLNEGTIATVNHRKKWRLTHTAQRCHGDRGLPYRIAAVEGVRLVATGYQPTMDDSGFSMRFRLEGKYHPMLNLISILEDLDPRLEVRSFAIHARSEALEMDIDLFYHLVEEEEE